MDDGSYERNERDFMGRVVRSGMHVVDVGAHIGYHAIHLAALVSHTGSVTAFEPVNEQSTVLVRTIEAKGYQGRVRLEQAAVGDRPGVRRMVIAGAGMSPANAYFHIGPRDENLTLRDVPVVTLDEAVSTRPIGFLKIDAEGAEAMILRGGRRLLSHDRPIVLVDVHPYLMTHLDGTTPHLLIREMAALKYECHLLGAGVPSSKVNDIHARGVTTIVFLPRESTPAVRT
jgi:FkbM family methyltransferase